MTSEKDQTEEEKQKRQQEMEEAKAGLREDKKMPDQQMAQYNAQREEEKRLEAEQAQPAPAAPQARRERSTVAAAESAKQQSAALSLDKVKEVFGIASDANKGTNYAIDVSTDSYIIKDAKGVPKFSGNASEIKHIGNEKLTPDECKKMVEAVYAQGENNLVLFSLDKDERDAMEAAAKNIPGLKYQVVDTREKYDLALAKMREEKMAEAKNSPEPDKPNKAHAAELSIQARTQSLYDKAKNVGNPPSPEPAAKKVDEPQAPAAKSPEPTYSSGDVLAQTQSKPTAKSPEPIYVTGGVFAADKPLNATEQTPSSPSINRR